MEQPLVDLRLNDAPHLVGVWRAVPRWRSKQRPQIYAAHGIRSHGPNVPGDLYCDPLPDQVKCVAKNFAGVPDSGEINVRSTAADRVSPNDDDPTNGKQSADLVLVGQAWPTLMMLAEIFEVFQRSAATERSFWRGVVIS
jgi:hypothetical protein